MKYLFLIATFFAIYTTTAQTSVKTFSVTSSDSYNGYKYDYKVTIKYQMSDAGYGNSPTALKVGFTNFEVTEVYYNDKRASSYLKNKNFPISKKLQADLNGDVSIKRGTLSISYSFKLGSVSTGALDNYDLTSSDRNKLFKTFSKDVTCNDISIQMNSAKITNLGVSFIGSIIDEMKAQIRYEKEQAKKVTENKVVKTKINQQNSDKTYKTNTTTTQVKNSDNTQNTTEKAAKTEAQRAAQLAAYKAEQAKIKRKNIQKKQAVANAAKAISEFSGGFNNNVFTDLRFSTNYRISENIIDEDDNDAHTYLDMITYDLGIGVGRNGFFSVGYGTPDYKHIEGSSIKIGIGFDLINLAPLTNYNRYGITIGIEGEFAFNNIESIEDNYRDVLSEDGTLYGGAVTIRLFELFYIGVGYGYITSEENGPNGNKTLKGNYSNTVLGLNIPF
ncbi:hypothetical protein [Polaribacter sargassicola]|uniref:hypothetical protein n=1 Tax=Polaribacter sargassicola TaxID=2836891 RepID=UPI001F38ADC6|nr:hypothetical protein [Polaribacter sp. DS7-9]MCG1037668.1 hypothetical protein [Polaribacter sp. DS7-9]